jgi:DNA-binding MarR family transcriptional regulator
MRCCKCCEMADYKTLYRLTNSLPYILNRVGVQMGELFSKRIRGFGVTLPMYRVMAALWEKPDQRLGDLAAMTSIEISTLSRLVGEMKRRGLVSRSRLRDNGRTVAINLAPKGRALAEELIPIAVHFEEVAVRNFPSRKTMDLKTVLDEIYQSLKSIEPEIEQADKVRKTSKKM